MNGSRLAHPQWHEVTAVFGGCFDPPHLGHREAVRGLFSEPGVKQVLVIPTASPAHKPAIVSAPHRLEMVKLSFKPTPVNPFPSDVEVSPLELERALSHPELPSYTFDTLLELRPAFSKLAWVVGSDQLPELFKWHRFPDLLAQSHWIILERKPHGSELARKTLQEWQSSGLVKPIHSTLWQVTNTPAFLTLVPTEATSVSSTLIREAIARTGAPPAGSLLPEVDRYLKINKLYGIRSPAS